MEKARISTCTEVERNFSAKINNYEKMDSKVAHEKGRN